MSALRAPLRLPRFRRLIAAYAVNALGTWLGEVALSVLVLRQTGSAAAVASVFVVGQFLPALCSPGLVTRLERLRTERALVALLTVQATVFAVLAAGAGGFALPLILALAALDGIAGLAASALTKASIATTTAPAGLLREANTIFVAVFTGCAALGPLLGGVLVAGGSVSLALAADAASFALAAGIVGLRENAAREDGAFTGPGEAEPRGGLRAGITHIRERPTLCRLLAGFGGMAAFASMILPVEIVLVTDTLGGTEAAYGTVLALWGLGAIFGSALLGVVRGAPITVLIAASFVVMAISYLGMGGASSVEVVGAFSLLGGIANGVEAFALMTAIQERTADNLQARVGAVVEAVGRAATGLGFLIGGAIATLASARAAYVLAGLGLLVLVVVVALPDRAGEARRAQPEAGAA